jgi:hypothetical protein
MVQDAAASGGGVDQVQEAQDDGGFAGQQGGEWLQACAGER